MSSVALPVFGVALLPSSPAGRLRYFDMALHLHPMLSLTATRGSSARLLSVPDSRQQKAHPPPPVRDLGPRAIQRLMNLKREEQEQELEDLESLKLTEVRRYASTLTVCQTYS